ncbi:MAG: hypothetical protein KJZ69_12415 [Phycisphaerales bacterium]|nr:hypothetical protein [Phycisphaerales bacterium]
MTAPIFKPFVMVRIPLPSGYTHGEVLGLNNSNQAVGWMHHQSSGKARPFVFDPALISTDPANAVSILDFATDTDSGKAYAISDADPPVIVGSLYYTPEAIDRAASWEVDGDFIAFYYDSETPSAAQGINADERVVGYYQYADEPYSFVIEGANNWNPAAASHSAAHGVNASGKVVGWHEVSAKSHAYSWVSNTTTDINPSGYDYSSALAVNDAGHIGGWVADTDEEEKIAALWNFVIPGVYTVEPFDTGASSAVTAINASGEMAITREDDSGVAIWSKRSGVDHADLLDDVTLMPGGSDVLNSARAINDNGWIGGSYLAGGTGNPQPCLIIPYDVDNNGSPDYREILEGKREGHTDLDTDSNGLLDWAENMRVGLHAPGTRGNNWSLISNRQVSRQSMHLRYLDLEDSEAYDESFPLDAVVAGGEACADFQEAMENWGRGTTQDPRQGEIIIWLRSSLEDGDIEYDYLPVDSTEEVDVLTDIQTFAYRYAKCIDYIQTGNEAFGGSGQYKIRPGELAGQGCGWTGDPKKLSEVRDLSVECQIEAMGLIFGWLKKQAWAALEGSALAGRPLRLIGPGVPSGFVDDGFGAQSQYHTGRYVTTQTSAWCNANQMYFDLHAHYISVSDATNPIEKLTDTYTGGGSAPWDVPNWLACLEVGPRVNASSAWAEANQGEFEEFMACGEPSYEDWADFVDSWENAQWFGQPDFGLESALAALAAVNFTVACYGPTVQTQVQNGIYDMAAIRATNVCSELIQATNRFTELKTVYQDEAYSYLIANFQPHPAACSGCPQ